MASNQSGDTFIIDIKATCTIDGAEFPVSAARVNYSVDEWPIAEIDLAIGVQANGNSAGAVSEADNILGNINPYTPVELFVTATPMEGAPEAPPGAPIGYHPGKSERVFRGYVANPTQARNAMASNASVRIIAIGEAAGLTGMTAAKRGLMVVTPLNAGMEAAINFQGGPSSLTIDAAMSSIVNDSLISDIYNDGIDSFFQAIAAAADQGTFDESNNPEVVTKALGRIVSGGGGGTFQGLAPLDMSGVVSESMLAECVRSYLARTAYAAWGDSDMTIWDLLMIYKASMHFYFLSAVEEDAVAAFSPSEGGDPFVHIGANEYFSIFEENNIHQDKQNYEYITSAAVLMKEFQISQWQQPQELPRAVGSYASDAMEGKPGRAEFISAPAWMTPRSAPARNGITDDGNSQQAALEATFFQPGSGAAGTIGDALAKTVVGEALFSNRSFTISGRWRLDIGLGSLVSVETVGNQLVGNSSKLFGRVWKVALHIEDTPGGGRIGTTLTIAYAKTEQDHAALGSEFAGCPLYNDASFQGAPLVPGL